jgi:hypothetical protein
MLPARLAVLVLAAGLGACVDGPAPAVSGAASCTSPASLGDQDDDLSIFGDACARETTFTERGVPWRVVTISANRPGPLFVLPHDDEDAALSTAAYALRRYGGTVTAVDNGGSRFNGGIDPNRNFSGGALRCPSGPTPAFVSAMLSPGGSPVIALHTNAVGSGSVTIRRPYAGATAFPSASATGGRASEDAMVIIAHRIGPDDPATRRLAERLNAAGVHVLVETVDTARTDCSLSHYAVANGLRYANVEVPDGDAATQREILDILMPLL